MTPNSACCFSLTFNQYNDQAEKEKKAEKSLFQHVNDKGMNSNFILLISHNDDFFLFIVNRNLAISTHGTLAK